MLVSCPINKCDSEWAQSPRARRSPQGISGILPRAATQPSAIVPTPDGRAGEGLWPRCVPWQYGKVLPAERALPQPFSCALNPHLFMGQDTRMRRHLVRACRRPSGIPPRGNSVQISVYLFAIALAHKHVRCRTSKTRKPSTTEPCIGSNRRIDLGLDAIHDLNHLSQSGLRPRRANSRRACKRAQPECVAARLPRDLRTSRSSKPLCEKWQWWASVPILWCSADVNTS